MNTWLRGITDNLTQKTIELLVFCVIVTIQKRLRTHDSSQNHHHVELNKAIISLSYAFTVQLTLSDKHSIHLQKELTHAQSRIDKLAVKVQEDFRHQTTKFLRQLLHISRYTDKLEVKTQDELKVPDRVKQETEVKV